MVDLQERMEQAQKGNEQAFGELYDAAYNRVWKFVYYKVGSREDADDIVGDTFYTAFTALSSYDPRKGTVLTRLYTIAYRTLISTLRRTKQMSSYDWLDEMESGDSVVDAATSRMQAAAVLEFLDGLKEEHKQIVLMRVWEELSYEEIGEILGLSPAACKQAYYRTVKSISERLGPVTLMLFLLSLA